MIKRNPIKQSELVNHLTKYGYSKPTIIKRINKLIEKNIISKAFTSNVKTNYLKLNKNKIKIAYDVFYYVGFYFTIFIAFIISLILSLFYKNIGIVFGSLITGLVVLIKCALDIFRDPKRKIIYIKL